MSTATLSWNLLLAGTLNWLPAPFDFQRLEPEKKKAFGQKFVSVDPEQQKREQQKRDQQRRREAEDVDEEPEEDDGLPHIDVCI